MSFASRIAAYKAAGTLVIGWQSDGTQAQLDELDRGTLTRFVVDPTTPPIESGSTAVKCGWNSGSDVDTSRGDLGGLALFSWKGMKAQYGSPGVDHRFVSGETFSLQWAERYTESFIGLASRCDTGYKGGVKTNMIDLELGTANTGTGEPDSSVMQWTTNSTMELVVSTSATITPFSVAHPTKASQTAYYSSTHIPMPNAAGVGGGILRPDRWVVYTVQVDLGMKWAVKYYGWQRAVENDPAHEHNVLNDYRNTDARWHLSSQQAAALAAGDAAALAAAPINQSAHHRFRMWSQYADWAEPKLIEDATFHLHNPYKWGAPEDPWFASFGQCNWTTLAYEAGQKGRDKGSTNIYGDLYTPYLQLKRSTDPYPDRFGPAATWPAWKWYDSLIVKRGTIDPKFYGGSDPSDPPPVLPDDVMIPSSVIASETP